LSSKRSHGTKASICTESALVKRSETELPVRVGKPETQSARSLSDQSSVRLVEVWLTTHRGSASTRRRSVKTLPGGSATTTWMSSTMFEPGCDESCTVRCSM